MIVQSLKNIVMRECLRKGSSFPQRQGPNCIKKHTFKDGIAKKPILENLGQKW